MQANINDSHQTIASYNMPSVSPPSNNSHGASLLDLPPEVRNMIYDLEYPVLPPFVDFFSKGWCFSPPSTLMDTCEQTGSETRLMRRKAKHNFFRCTFLLHLDHYRNLEIDEVELDRFLQALMQHLSHHDIRLIGTLDSRTRSPGSPTEDHFDRMVVLRSDGEVSFSGRSNRNKHDLRDHLLDRYILRPSDCDPVEGTKGQRTQVDSVVDLRKAEIAEVVAAAYALLRAQKHPN